MSHSSGEFENSNSPECNRVLSVIQNKFVVN